MTPMMIFYYTWTFCANAIMMLTIDGIESLMGKRLIEDDNLHKIQDRLGEEISGVFGKGGAGLSLSIGVSKNL